MAVHRDAKKRIRSFTSSCSNIAGTFVKAAEAHGVPRRTAIIEAGRVRLRPILMTTFALLAGMVPVALGMGEGADVRAPLGRAVIGGVLTSTILTLLVVPVAYEMLSDARDRAMARFRGETSDRA